MLYFQPSKMKLFKASYNDWNRSWVSIQVRIWKFHEFRENGHFWSKMSIFGQTYIFLYLFVSVYFDKKKVSENFTETNLSGKWSRDIHQVELIPFLNNSILSDKKSDRKIPEKITEKTLNNETKNIFRANFRVLIFGYISAVLFFEDGHRLSRMYF